MTKYRRQSVVTPGGNPQANNPSNAPVIVVGAGPVGIRFIQELHQRAPQQAIILYGDEPWDPYDRIRLSSLLAGEIGLNDLSTRLNTDIQDQLVQFLHCRVTAIDPAERTITDAQGRCQPYSQLVLATGSTPHIPSIAGREAPGVYKFRDLGDVEQLLARTVRSRHTVVLGGGLLGLEAARAMQQRNTQVTVIQHADRLMNRQLDEAASDLLITEISELGIQIRLKQSVKQINSNGRVHSLTLRDGEELDCDTVIFCTGISPNTTLAREAKLNVGRGIIVDDQMRTSDPNIYAIGECIEHAGRVYGLVAPGYEQAAVAAHNITTDTEAAYTGTVSASRLKVVGHSVFSMGEVGDEHENPSLVNVSYADTGRGIYRKLVLRRGTLVGAIVIGPCTELNRIQEAVSSQRLFYPWQLWRFKKQGQLWGKQATASVNQWPANAIICNCTGMTRGQLSDALLTCEPTPQALMQCTGAGTVCGSCRPLLAELAGQPTTAPEPVKGARPVLIASVLAFIAALLLSFTPAIPFSDTVQGLRLDSLWLDGLIKQITGFTLLGLSLIALLMSVAKRWRKIKLGSFPYWRVAHTLLGVSALIVLVLHTGLHLGVNLNRWLIIDFLALSLVGGLAGLVVALERRLQPAQAKRLRSYWTWTHILLFWPLPILLTFHILAVYYY